jgi:hypothetical protein
MACLRRVMCMILPVGMGLNEGVLVLGALSNHQCVWCDCDVWAVQSSISITAPYSSTILYFTEYCIVYRYVCILTVSRLSTMMDTLPSVRPSVSIILVLEADG